MRDFTPTDPSGVLWRIAAARTSTSNRIVDFLFGIFFVVLAVAIVVYSDQPFATGSIIAALLVGGLGVEAIVSAARARRSLLAKIGPLP